MFSPTTSSSLMPSRCFTRARRLFPWAATSTVAPVRRSGTIASYQYGSLRTTTSARHSGAGRGAGGRVRGGAAGQHADDAVGQALGGRPGLRREGGVARVVPLVELAAPLDRRR